MGVKSLFTRHARKPEGFIGRLIAKLMWTKTRKSNLWTGSLLNISVKDTVLEIGFGLGYTIREISELALEGLICGIDISETMINYAKKINSVGIRKRPVDIRLGKVEQIPYGQRVFNKILAINVIYLWPDLESAIKEIKRVLMNGGTAYCILAEKQ